jgi:hypothetical protein
MGGTFRIYIFDESHKYVPEEYPEFEDFLKDEVEYIQVSDMDEVKEDLLNRRFRSGPLGEYGIMLARNKCEVHTFCYGFDNYYIEEDYMGPGVFLNYIIGKGDILACIPKDWLEICPHGWSDKIRVYTYKSKRLNIQPAKFKYIDVSNEDDIKKDLLYRGFELSTYMILDEYIKLKNINEGYKNYKVITEREIEDRIKDIMSDRYDIIDKIVIVFTINAKFDSHKNFKSVPVSNIGEMKGTFRKLRNEANDPYTFQNWYYYLMMPNEGIRLYDGFKDGYVVVDVIKELGFAEMHSLLLKK